MHATPDERRAGARSKYPTTSSEEEVNETPKFIDTHGMDPLTADVLKKLQTAPSDEFGVTHHDILFNERENKVYCVLNAPNRAAVEKHHAKAGLKCDWIHEVKSTRA
jgi:hypothetical protein